MRKRRTGAVWRNSGGESVHSQDEPARNRAKSSREFPSKNRDEKSVLPVLQSLGCAEGSPLLVGDGSDGKLARLPSLGSSRCAESSFPSLRTNQVRKAHDRVGVSWLVVRKARASCIAKSRMRDSHVRGPRYRLVVRKAHLCWPVLAQERNAHVCRPSAPHGNATGCQLG